MTSPVGDGTAALLLGGNLGDRLFYLRAAADLLRASGVGLAAASPIFDTQPAENAAQPWYLNRVLLVRAGSAPESLLALCRGVEASLGRHRRAPKGPRTLDVDILFWGGLVRATPRLILPHPALARRRSALAPLALVAPEWRHPVLGSTAAELLAACRDPLAVRLLPPELQDEG